ncbi:AHNK2 protein, partial [Acrocephalus arundinaceus]|nr:AHNK2 protein [Acrocephalus arundinaceus]
IKAPKVDISLPSVDVTLPQASVDLQAPEASVSLEGEAKVPEKEAVKTKDGKFKMPKFGMPSFGWSSSREAKGTVAAEVDVSLKEPEVTVPSAAAEVDVTLPSADIQAPGVEVTVETAALAAEGEKGRFKMPDVKMPSVKLPKVKAPHAQVSLPTAEVSLAKGPEGEVALQGPEAEASLEVAAGKAEGGGMKIHMPKVKVPSVVFSKPTVKAPKLDADVSLPQAELKAAEVSITAPDIKVPSVEGSLELHAPDIDLKAPSAEGKLEGTGLKGKLKMPKFDKPKFAVSSPKAEAPAAEVSLPSAEVDLPSATVTAAVEGSELGFKADVPGAKTEGGGWKLEKPSLKMPKADIKAPKVDISLPSVDVTLPQASVDLQAPEASVSLEGEAKVPEKEAVKTKDGKFKMPKFGMPSFGWSSSREAKGTVAAEVDVSLKEPEVTVPSAAAEVDVTLPSADIQAPGVEVTVETAALAAEGEKGRFKMPDVKMPSVKLPKVKAPHAQVSLPTAEVSLAKGPEGEVALQGPEAEASLEVAAGKAEGGGMKIHMPKVKVPSVVFSKPTVKAPKLDADVSLPQAELKAAEVSITAPDIKVPSVEGSLELHAPDIDLKAPSAEGKLEGTGLKGKLKMPKFDKPKFAVSSPKAEAPAAEVSLPSAEVDLPSATVTAAVEGSELGFKADVPGAKTEGGGWKLEKPSLKMPKADIKAPKVDISLPSVDVTLPQASVDLQAPEASVSLEGEAKVPEKEAVKTKDGKFKMPKFGMPSFGWSSSREAKGTVAAEVDVSLKEPEVTVPSAATEVGVTVPDSEIQDPMPKVTAPTLEFSKPEAKAPKIEMDISMPTGDITDPTCEKDELTLKSAAASASLSTSDIKMIPEHSLEVESPDLSVERTSGEIAVGVVEIKAEGSEGKTKMSKFQMPKADDSIKIPDIEKSHPEGTEEGAQISIKLDDTMVHTLEFSRVETEASKTEITVSSAKADAPLIPSEGSFQQVDLKVSSTNECNIQKTAIKLPKGEASVDLKSPDVVTESSSVVGGRKVKLEGPEGKIKMPKFQKTKFGISLTKGKVPETEISSPKIEAELPQLRMTNEIADIAVGAPASELTSDMSDPGVVDGIQKLGDSVKGSDVSLPKMEGDISLSTERTDSRVNIAKTETYADVVKRSVEGHTSEITVSVAELSKSYPSASETDKDKSSANRFPTSSARITGQTVDQTQGVPEVTVRIPKLKIPRFTFRTLPIEADVLLSKVVTDPKGSSTDIEI